MAKTGSTRQERKKKVRPRQSAEMEYWKGRCADLERELQKLKMRDGIVLEPCLVDGFLTLRDKVSKLRIKYIKNVEVSNASEDEFQEAIVSVVVDPRVER